MMIFDETTLDDLSIFSKYDNIGLFNKLDKTKTNGGNNILEQIFRTPKKNIAEINEQHEVLKWLNNHDKDFENNINNGTIMVIQKLYETNINIFSATVNNIDSYLYSKFDSVDYKLLKYSIQHFHSFLQSINKIAIAINETAPRTLYQKKIEIIELLKEFCFDKFHNLKNENNIKKSKDILQYSYQIKYKSKASILRLIYIYYELDAWQSMSIATKEFGFSYPNFIETDSGIFECSKMFHPLLKLPTSYDIDLKNNKNFLFLTGANMAGKSTYIKTLGIVAYLAHIGMGVPANNCKLSYFDSIISNINLTDNIIEGHSYFYNEVRRVKATTQIIAKNKKALILIDELFKGTNVEDAIKCSITVIEGFLKSKKSCFILSTHLYEIGTALNKYPNIDFKYFETGIKNGLLDFSYQLKDGISNDRIGYLILKQEGVIDLLDKL